jgi:5-methylcytosine-specific restriction endonuclease McrA
MALIAASDRTFTRADGRWTGKCLICNGRLGFDERDGEGADIEHIIPRSAGGTSDLHNLALTHPRCNREKGRNWDAPRQRRARPDRYAALIERLQAERARRWREPDAPSIAALDIDGVA